MSSMLDMLDVRVGNVPKASASRVTVLPSSEQDDDALYFVDEADDRHATADDGNPPWVVLIVDDEQDVHDSTRIALDGERVLGRRLKLLHAYTAAQAREMVAADVTIAMVLLDVVMETQDAGLRLAAEIREDYASRDVRIIIRTGQPGYATDLFVAENTTIDGYLTKARLTRAMLIDAIAEALGARGRDTDASPMRD